MFSREKTVQNLNDYSKKKCIGFTILTKNLDRKNYKKILDLDLNW